MEARERSRDWRPNEAAAAAAHARHMLSGMGLRTVVAAASPRLQQPNDAMCARRAADVHAKAMVVLQTVCERITGNETRH
jgi:hypothetical protein